MSRVLAALPEVVRQGIKYSMVGGLALAVDWAFFVAVTWFGFSTIWANISARLCGALVAFALNGVVTFATQEGSCLGLTRFSRYAATWVFMTLVSTGMVSGIESATGLTWAWVAKPLVETALAAATFFIYRHWIYR